MTRSDIPSPVGVVGLGAMGSTLARRLVDCGTTVLGFDIDAGARQRCAAWGIDAAPTPASLAGRASVVLTCLPDAPEVEAAVLGPGGVAEGAAAGSLLVECSTIDPDVTRRVAARLRPRGVGVADAAIGRSLEHARRGEASLMVGADDATYQRALPVLTALASRSRAAARSAPV